MLERLRTRMYIASVFSTPHHLVIPHPDPRVSLLNFQYSELAHIYSARIRKSQLWDRRGGINAVVVQMT